jgi:uncharacterized protein
MQTNYLIIPGFGNSGAGHWQSYFEKQLKNCIRIEQEDWEKPTCASWVNSINTIIGKYKPETLVVVTHSLGGIALAHWAAQHPTKIRAAMLVAPPNLDQPYQNLGLQSFTPIPRQKLPFTSHIIASTNDPWATVPWSIALANSWGSELFFLENAGHINGASGFGTWPEGINYLKNL